MMHGAKESDSLIVPGKLANKAGRPVAESTEGSGGIEGNAELQSMVRTQSREAVKQAQSRIREAVDRNPQEKLTALLHHVTVDMLRWSFFRLKKKAAPGVDGVTWEAYEADLENNLADLHVRIHRGAYRAQPSRRRYIRKPGGGQRPLGIAALTECANLDENAVLDRTGWCGTSLLNRWLGRAFAFETPRVLRGGYPFGTSVLCVAQKAGAGSIGGEAEVRSAA